MCAIVGVYDRKGKAAGKAVLALTKLQNRGPQSAGAVSSDGTGFHEHRGEGLVETVFNTPETVERLAGRIAVGQNRYATIGYAIQPLVGRFHDGSPFAITHNGEFSNAVSLTREAQERWDYSFRTTSDTEVLLPFLEHAEEPKFRDALLEILRTSKIQGAFSLVILHEGKLYCVRDPHGFRPLAWGIIGEDGMIVTSESSAIEALGGRYIADVEAGQLVVIGSAGVEEATQYAQPRRSSCVMEHIYFANPDSYVERTNVSQARDAGGRTLFREEFEKSGYPEVDAIIPILDSGLHAAIGYQTAAMEYAFENGKKPIPLVPGIHRTFFLGRSFLQPDQLAREALQKIKSNVIAPRVRGKRVIVVDDSLIRGIVTRTIVTLLRLAGVREVHIRIASPPPMFPCPYGIDTYANELIARLVNGDEEEVRRFTKADSLQYLSLRGLQKSVVGAKSPPVRTEDDFCYACFTGTYPVPFEQDRRVKPNGLPRR